MSDYPAGDATTLSLDAIAYGAFTKAGTDQAYVTYTSDFEPHANNMGGGILFERQGRQWHLIRWIHGGQMDRCVALPPEIPQRMLCLTGYAGMGEVDSSVWVDRVASSKDDKLASIAILKAQDDREADNNADGSEVYECSLRHSPHEAVLLSVDDLRRSTKPGIFAVSKITYVTARDADAACRKKHFEDAKETTDAVFYRLVQGKIVAQSPATFAHTDY
jgi:hypothetical protein